MPNFHVLDEGISWGSPASAPVNPIHTTIWDEVTTQPSFPPPLDPDLDWIDPTPPPTPLHPTPLHFGDPPELPSWQTTLQNKIQKKKMKEPNSNIFYNQTLMEFIYSIRDKKKDGEVGLEIECEGTNLFNSPVKYWAAKHDGSLRTKAGHPPVEYILREPLIRSEIPAALNYLSRNLLKSSSKVEESPRTSVHVHVNCQKLTLKETFTYICLYLLFESSLTQFSGPTRSGNLFCLRAKDAEYWVWAICNMFQNAGDLSTVCSEELRYTSCNTSSLTKYGSLEFRSMRGTIDIGLIQLWVDTLLHLKDESLVFKDPVELYEKYITLGPSDFFNYVFYSRPEIRRTLLGTDYISSMEEGSRFVRDIASCLPEWKEKIEKEKVKEKKRSLYDYEEF